MLSRRCYTDRIPKKTRANTAWSTNIWRDWACYRQKPRRRAVVASSPGFSLLPRNNLRMTFDPPERKAESIFARDRRHMTSRATRIYVRVTRFSRESSVEARNRNAIGSLSGKKPRSLLETLELEESSGPPRSTISRNYHREPELQWELERHGYSCTVCLPITYRCMYMPSRVAVL